MSLGNATAKELETVLDMPADGSVPGVVVHHVHASTGVYASSPALAALADGTYVAALDLFGPGCDHDETLVYASSDKGATWQQIADMKGQWWSSLFVHRDALYIIGVTTEYGNWVIRRSTDAGKTWTTPDSPTTGLLGDGRYHCNVVPTLFANGRIWRGMEDAKAAGNWGAMFRAFVVHASEDADLLDASSWTSATPMPRERAWLGGDFKGWLEGNALLTPDGEIINLLRVQSVNTGTEKAAIVHLDSDGVQQSFDPESDIIEFPGGAKKFVIRYDERSGRYISLVNDVPTPDFDSLALSARNTLSLISSADLRNWDRHATILRHADDKLHGYQYVDWLFENDDIIFLSRSAHGTGDQAAHSFHDSNYITFHRLENFAELLKKQEPTGEA